MEVISVSIAIMMFVLAFSGCTRSPGNEGNKDPVTWERPAYVTLEKLDFNQTSQEMEVIIHLWDVDDEATEWDGVVTLIIMDANLDEVFNRTWSVTTKDFKTVVTGSSRVKIYDTYLDVSVAVSELEGADPNAYGHPEWSWDARAFFAFEGEVMASLPQWLPPIGVQVRGADLDVDDNEFDIEVHLQVLDYMMTTKASGFLTVVMTDGIGMEMYNDTMWVNARDFVVSGRIGTDVVIEWDVSAYVIVTVPVEDIQPSFDTTSGHGMVQVNVIFDNLAYTIEQKGSRNMPLYPIEIPKDLLTYPESTPPVAVATCPRYCDVGEVVRFDASSSIDSEDDIVVYRWNWDDPTPTVETTKPIITREMKWKGKHDIVLTVIDRGGNKNSTVLRLSVGEPLIVTFLEVGVVEEATERYNYTYVRLSIENMGSESKRSIGSPEFQLRDGTQEYRKVDIEGDVPIEYAAGEVVEVIVYYVKYGPGNVPVPIVPTAMMVWDTYPQDWLEIPGDLFR